MANRWYVKLGDEELGPLSDSGLDRLIEAGGIQGDTLVRSGPSAPWTPVQSVSGLMTKLARPSPSSSGGVPTSPPKGPAPRPPTPPPVVMLPAAPVLPAAAEPSFGKWELGLGAAACLIAFAAAWGAAHLASSRASSSAANSSAAAGQLAVLKQETDLLQRELLSARRQLDDLRRAPPQPPVSPPPTPAPPPVDLAAERKSLAEALARDWANQEDAAARLRHDLSHVIDPALDAVAGEPYKSQADELFRQKLPEVERELAAADHAQLAKRTQELQRQQSESRQKTGQLLADAKAAIKRCDLERGDELLKQYLASGYAERRDDAVAVLKELTRAKPLDVVEGVEELTPHQMSELASTERLPANWPHKYADPDVAEAVRVMAVRLAKCVHGSVRSGEFFKRAGAELDAYELAPLRKAQFVREVGQLDLERDLTPAKAAELVDAYGFFRFADLAPQIDDALNVRVNRLLADETERTVERVARGELEFVSLGELCRKARQMAGDAWPADDAALPYAGHWMSRDRWHLYIDPWRDAIVYRKSSPPGAFEQRVCKLAPGYLVGYERRAFGAIKETLANSQNPFWKERYDQNKDEAPEIDGPDADENVALTLYVFKPGEGKTLRLYRRYKNPAGEAQIEEIKGQTFWKSLGNESLYRPYEDVYRYVNDKLAPE